jgi:aryl-alcohol dehydrogenase-like predicted oxidoreductase
MTRHGPGIVMPVGRPEYLRQCVLMSLRRLKLEQIPLWQLHRIDPKVPRDEQFGVIAEMLKEGLIKHAGLSQVSVEEIEAARKVFPVASVQNLYNLTDRSSEAGGRLLRRQHHRLHLLVPAGRRQAGRAGDRAGRHRPQDQGRAQPDRPGLDPEAQPDHAAHPRRQPGRPPGRQCPRRRDPRHR